MNNASSAMVNTTAPTSPPATSRIGLFGIARYFLPTASKWTVGLMSEQVPGSTESVSMRMGVTIAESSLRSYAKAIAKGRRVDVKVTGL